MLKVISGFLISGAFAFTAGTVPIDPPLPNIIPTQADAFVVAASIPEIPQSEIKFNTPPKWTYCSCVEYAKWLTDHEGTSYGAAKNIKPNLDQPAIGAWALMNEGPGHAAAIVEIDPTLRKFRTDESNYFRCAKSTRWLSFDDPKIRGYFQP